MNSLSNPPPGVISALLSMDEHIGYVDGVSLYELRLKRREDGWLAILKGTRGNEWLVAFAGSGNLSGILTAVGELVDKQMLRWQQDKFPPSWALKQMEIF